MWRDMEERRTSVCRVSRQDLIDSRNLSRLTLGAHTALFSAARTGAPSFTWCALHPDATEHDLDQWVISMSMVLESQT